MKLSCFEKAITKLFAAEHSLDNTDPFLRQNGSHPNHPQR